MTLPPCSTVPSLLLLLCLAASPQVLQGSETPYGHADFYPSTDRPVGLQGDGNGLFPGATPSATQWDFITGKNIIWQTALPSFGFSSPIVVGDKIFVTAEFDLLICLNARDGSILWVTDCQGIDTVAGDKAETVKKEWKDLWTVHSRGLAMVFESVYLQFQLDLIAAGKAGEEFEIPAMGYSRLGKSGKKPSAHIPHHYASKAELTAHAKKLAATSDEEVARLQARLADVQKIIDEEALAPQTSAYVPVGSPHLRKSAQEAAYKERYGKTIDRLRRDYGLAMEYWNGWLNAFPTPVSDGKHVYAQFFNHQIACCDLDGNIKWIKVFPPTERVAAAIAQNNCVSPILDGDQLFIHLGGDRAKQMTIYCLNKSTGEVIWERKDHKLDSRHSFNQIKLMKTDTVRAIVSGSGLIVNADDGEAITTLIPYPHQIIPPMVHEDVAVFMPGGGMTGGRMGGWYAVQIKNKDGKLHPEYLWAYVPKGKKNPLQCYTVLKNVVPENMLRINEKNITGPSTAGVIVDGKIKFPYLVIDMNDGKNILGGDGKKPPKIKPFGQNKPVPYSSRGHNILAGDYLISSGHNGNFAYHGIFAKDDLSTCISLNRTGSVIMRDLQLGKIQLQDVLDRIYQHHYEPKLGLMNHSTVFAQGDRLYIRTRDSVFCVGDPAKPYHSPASTPPEAKTN